MLRHCMCDKHDPAQRPRADSTKVGRGTEAVAPQAAENADALGPPAAAGSAAWTSFDYDDIP